jgi:uncharacterized protein YjbI with pentapeptide repeats
LSRRLRERRLSRAARRVDEPAAPDPLKKFAEKAHDLDLVRKSVDDAASVSVGLWLSYLFALFYIGVAAGGVTHKDLLLENPVRLPFLNVELPFVAFFALAPVLFVVSHAYTLMHFVLLAAKVGAYNVELEKQIPEPALLSTATQGGERRLDHREIRRGLRRQLPSNIFVQFLAGPLDIREGGLGWLLKAIAWISLVIGPVLLLLLIQVQFLPYHLEWVTWIQRLALLADVALLWLLWPAVLGAHGDIRWPRFWRHPAVTLVSLVPIALAFVVARYPGEWVDHHVGTTHWIPPYPQEAWHEAKDWRGLADAWLHEPGWTSVHDLLFNGDVDDVTRRRKSLFSNTLVLPEFDGLAAAGIDDPKKLDGDGIKHSLVLRGRHLKGAVLTHADLRKADLESAKLEGANLAGAQLQGAKLDRAQLQGASLDRAQLQGASLLRAQLQMASLDNAKLQGALLRFAMLQGATLAYAQLQGATLQEAQLEGATLDAAHLQGALLGGAHLQGATLLYVHGQGASLVSAQLQGASLAHAQLLGADFKGSTLDATNLNSAAVWRAIVDDASPTDVRVMALDETAISKNAFTDVIAWLKFWVPEGEVRDRVLKRLEGLDPDLFGPEVDVIGTLEKGHVEDSSYREALARELGKLVCSEGPSSVFIIRGLIRNQRLFDAGPSAAAFIEKTLAPECPVSTMLTDDDKTKLARIAKETRTFSPRQ